MPGDTNRGTDLLALCCEPRLIGSMRRELTSHGVRVDVAESLADLRTAFFARGGHDVFVVTPDIPPSLAERAVHVVLDLDPDVLVVAFGRELERVDLPGTVTRLPEHHPSSRAGVGAILRVAFGLG